MTSALKASTGAQADHTGKQVTLPFQIWIEQYKPALWLLPFTIAFVLFEIAPMLWVLINSFIKDNQWSLGNFTEVLTSQFYLQAFENSWSIALWSSVIGLVVALVTTASLVKVDNKVRDLVIAFTNMTSNFTGVPLAFSFIIILGFNGALTLLFNQWGLLTDFNLYSKSGLMLIYIYFQIPLAVLLLYPAFDALQDDWESAAALLGASKLNYWRYIALPVLSPALLGTFIILFANAMGAYASAYALTTGNYNMVTIRIGSLVSGDIFLQPNMAAALSVLLMIILGIVAIANHWLLKRSYYVKG